MFKPVDFGRDHDVIALDYGSDASDEAGLRTENAGEFGLEFFFGRFSFVFLLFLYRGIGFGSGVGFGAGGWARFGVGGDE